MSDNTVFQLTGFRPVGFVEKKYPVKNCAFCRGLLCDDCYICKDDNQKQCYVKYSDDKYYHGHCLYEMSKIKKN